jgi:hypothetical protein
VRRNGMVDSACKVGNGKDAVVGLIWRLGMAGGVCRAWRWRWMLCRAGLRRRSGLRCRVWTGNVNEDWLGERYVVVDDTFWNNRASRLANVFPRRSSETLISNGSTAEEFMKCAVIWITSGWGVPRLTCRTATRKRPRRYPRLSG